MRGVPDERDEEFLGFCIISLRGVWDRLIRLAYERGTTLHELSRKAGVSSSAVYRSVRSLRGTGEGFIDASFDQIMLLTEALGASPDYILNGKEPKMRDTDYTALALSIKDLPIETKERLRVEVLSHVKL